jgi:hypothetical protein
MLASLGTRWKLAKRKKSTTAFSPLESEREKLMATPKSVCAGRKKSTVINSQVFEYEREKRERALRAKEREQRRERRCVGKRKRG